MDTQELHDSLEEDFHSASENSLLHSKCPESKFINESRDRDSDDSLKTNENLKPSEDITDLTTLVPLYNGETNKCVLSISKINKKNSRKSCIPIRIVTDSSTDAGNIKSCIINCKNRLLNSSNIELLPKLISKKSYTSMLRSRIGFPEGMKKIASTDTARTIHGDSTVRTIGSLDDSFLDLENCSVSDNSSFYFEHMKTEVVNTCRNSNKSANCSEHFLPHYNKNHDNKNILNSVSEHNVKKKFSKVQSKIKHNAVSPLVKVATLGKLGPDPISVQEKLEKLNKQQAYGLRASLNNRIRLKETKSLLSIQQDVKSVHCQ